MQKRQALTTQSMNLILGTRKPQKTMQEQLWSVCEPDGVD